MREMPLIKFFIFRDFVRDFNRIMCYYLFIKEVFYESSTFKEAYLNEIR